VIRAFIALTLNSAVIEKIAGASTQLRAEIAGVRWVTPANFHLTIKFLGSLDEALIERIQKTLEQQLRPFPRFTISAKGLGVFPGPKRPRVLWVGLNSDRLVSLASRVESALQPLGFATESRAFTPHLTIGRWRQTDVPPESLGRQLENWKAYDFGASRVEYVKVIQSLLKPDGASYADLATIPLKVE
jgi:RNA 2',3'-cyclic 3'-phosphodiesterase